VVLQPLLKDMGKLSPEDAKKARENGRKGGRPPGSKAPETIQRDAAIKEFRQRVANNADRLFDYQMSLAKGAQYLFRIDKEWIKTGTKKDGTENGYWRNKKPVQVEDPEEMRQYLEDEITNGDAEDEFDPSASYYFLVARDPQNQAIDSMLDRTFGRSKSELDVNIKVPKPIYGGGALASLPEGMKKLPPKKIPKKDIVVLSPQKGEKVKA
jgi:hypothetical protein